MLNLKTHTRATGNKTGFTIVELLIVVVVIAILASITIVSYNGIINRAHQSKLISDVASAGMLMSVDQSSSGIYPATRAEVNNGKGLNNDADITYTFHSAPTTFCITGISTHPGIKNYYVSNKNLSPLEGTCPEDLGAQVATLAGNGTSGYANGVGTAAILAGPVGITSDPTGNIYFTDAGGSRIRMVTTTGTVSTLAGAGGSSYAEGTGTSALFNWPQSITIGAAGLLYVTDTNNHRIRSVTTGGISAFVAGGAAAADAPSTTGSATGSAAGFRVARGIVYSPTANLIYVADSENNKIRSVTPGGVSTTLAGQVSGGLVNATGTAAKFNYPQGLAIDSSGNIIVADTRSHTIRKVTPGGVVTQIAGGGTTTFGQAGYFDANGSTARFNGPMAVAIDSAGVIYVADTGNQRIRKIATNGDVTTVAGNGTAGFQDGLGTEAMFSSPQGIAIGSDGRLYITDTTNNRLRVITNF